MAVLVLLAVPVEMLRLAPSDENYLPTAALRYPSQVDVAVLDLDAHIPDPEGHVLHTPLYSSS